MMPGARDFADGKQQKLSIDRPLRICRLRSLVLLPAAQLHALINRPILDVRLRSTTLAKRWWLRSGASLTGGFAGTPCTKRSNDRFQLQEVCRLSQWKLQQLRTRWHDLRRPAFLLLFLSPLFTARLRSPPPMLACMVQI